MIVKAIETERYQDYKLPAMFIAMPRCSFKCEKGMKRRVCQNGTLANLPDIKVDTVEVIKKYLSNPITKAIIFGGLEPMDSFDDVYSFLDLLRKGYLNNDFVVIYTGYTKEECDSNGWLKKLREYKNVIVKFGRYIPKQAAHYDKTLGVYLASDNQYAEVIC